MMGVIFALLLAQLSAASSAPASPAPSASPLKQIIDVKARPMCQTLVQSVQPAIAGLMKNDELIVEGQKAFTAIADTRRTGGSTRMPMLMAKNVVGALVHNIEQIDSILDNPARFPAAPSTDDERLTADMKTQLLAILTTQKQALNVLNGMVETHALSRLQHHATLATAPPAGTVPTAGPDPDDPSQVTTAGISNVVQNAATGKDIGVDTRSIGQGTSATGPSVWGDATDLIGSLGVSEAREEAAAHDAVVAVVERCRPAP